MGSSRLALRVPFSTWSRHVVMIAASILLIINHTVDYSSLHLNGFRCPGYLFTPPPYSANHVFQKFLEWVENSNKTNEQRND